jgi:peptide/nickel transport system permease protein
LTVRNQAVEPDETAVTRLASTAAATFDGAFLEATREQAARDPTPQTATEHPIWRGAAPLLTRPVILLSVLVIATVLLSALVPGWVAPFDPTDMDGDAILSAPGAAHWLGTDNLGRDVLSLLVYGARDSLLMGFCAVGLGGVAGGLIGLAAGFGGRAPDMVLMRLLDIWMSVPDILLAIIIASSLGASLSNTILAVGLVTLPRYARVMRGQVIALRGRPFVEASRAIGTSPMTILVRHILPHTLSPMLVMVTLGVANAILIGASLSFIGLGVIDDRPAWGFLLSQGRSYLSVAWWIATFPGLAVTALVIAVNLLGDGLRDRYDPKTRTGRWRAG